MMDASSAPTDFFLTSNICTLCETVQPTSTEFNIFCESPPLQLQSPQLTATIEYETIQNTSLPSSIPSEVSPNKETIEAACTLAHPSFSSCFDTVITNAAVLQTSARESRCFEPSLPSPRGSSLIDSLKNCPKDLGFNVFLDELAAEITDEDLKRLKLYVIVADTDEGERTECLPMHVLQLPSEDWRFNIFLDDLASNISDEELARLKNYVSGDGGLGLRILEQINTPLELFKILKKRMIVSKDNLITLQSMLWHLKNKELHKKAVEYAMDVGNTLYFYAPSDKPENGYKHVKLHVQGKDFSKIRRSDLEQLRTIVSQLVMIPAQFVFVSGLEPSSSFIITFMIPEYHVSVLVEIISKHNIHDLTELGIDTIYIDDKKFSLSGADEFEVLMSQEEQNVAKTFARLQVAEQQLEQRDIEYLKLSRELETKRQELKQVGQNKQNICNLMGALNQLHLFQKDLGSINGEVSSLKIQSALANLRFSLRKVKDLKYDTDVIMSLLQANSYLVDIRVRAEFISRMKYLMTDIERQKALIISQQQSIHLLQFVSESTPEEAFTIVMSQLLNFLQQIANQTVGVNIPLPLIQILRKYSHLLHKRERQKLHRFHTWSKEEDDIVEKNPSLFLEMLVVKECQRFGGSINLANYIPPMFEEVQRKDLARRYLDDIKRLESEQRRQTNDATAHGVQPQATPLNEQQQSQQLDEMNTRLKNVENMIKELVDNKNESPRLLRDYITPMNMPIWSSKLPSFVKEHREAEHTQPPTKAFL
ncbi:hypothetical protein CHS0354_020286 [Potamilus streckersoni]|uniref:DED domain-containing protein n=1 Tax=Potamilus streckersoni TaxID=2493646 RepID=A0AAE0VPF3_9BIVA|nr:hypothetical protein CHS0354_020286 [Potamilus streckersoni]